MKLPRFTLRDLFWLVLVCALALGWWMERLQVKEIARENRELTKGIETQQRQMNSLMEAIDPNATDFVFMEDDAGKLKPYPVNANAPLKPYIDPAVKP